jgi:outer membrane cobalamin receptor
MRSSTLTLLLASILFLRVDAAHAWTLQGRVLNADNAQALAGANLRVLGSDLGCATDLQGRFRLQLGDRVRARVLVTHLGFRGEELDLIQEDLRPSAQTLASEPFATHEDFSDLIVELKPSLIAAGELVYTADLREQTVRQASTKVDIISRDALQRTPAQDLSRVLETVPGVSVKRSDGVTTNSLSIRGSSNLLGGGVGNRVLLLLDGKPMINADTGGADWSMVPLSIIERVEVVKGAYSALYGSAAMGGVINLVTLQSFPKHLTLVRTGFGMGERPPLEQRFRDTHTTENNLSITHMNQLPKLGYFLSYSKRESNGHRQNSDYQMHNLGMRFRFGEVSAKQQWEWNLAGAWLNRGFPHSWDSLRRPFHLNAHHPEWLNDRQQKTKIRTDFSWQHKQETWSLKALVWLNAGLSESMYHDAELSDTRSRADKQGLRLSYEVIAWPHHEIVMGIDAEMDRVEGLPKHIYYGKHQANNIAVFVQDQHTVPIGGSGLLHLFADPILTLGLRADHHVVLSHSSETLISPKAGLSLSGTKWLSEFTFRASAGRAFRSPTIADLFLKSVPGNDYSFRANPNLRAEENLSVDAGVLWTPLSGLALDASIFRSSYRDMIHYRDTEDVSVFEIINLQRAEIQGCELTVDMRLDDWAGKLGYTLVDAENADTREPLPYQPRHHISGSLSWTPGKWNVSATGRSVSATEKVRFYATDAPGSYVLLGLKAAYKMQSVEVALSGENLGAVQYEEMERYRMPGRTLRLDLLFRL